MAVIVTESRDVDIQDLDMGQTQTRTHEVRKDIVDLEESIRVLGVLHPILVAPSKVPGKYSIIAGQRRVLACQGIGRTNIPARIFSEVVTESEAIAISVAENMVRRDPIRMDMIDACTKLFNHYGSFADVARATGLPYEKVREFVRIEQLMPELQQKVRGDPKKLKQAIRAQKAAEARAEDGVVSAELALNFFEDFQTLPGVKQEEVLTKANQDPKRGHEEILEEVRTGSRGTQFTITLGPRASESLTLYANETLQVSDPAEAAAQMVLDGLEHQGLEVD